MSRRSTIIYCQSGPRLLPGRLISSLPPVLPANHHSHSPVASALKAETWTVVFFVAPGNGEQSMYGCFRSCIIGLPQRVGAEKSSKPRASPLTASAVESHIVHKIHTTRQCNQNRYVKLSYKDTKQTSSLALYITAVTNQNNQNVTPWTTTVLRITLGRVIDRSFTPLQLSR